MQGVDRIEKGPRRGNGPLPPRTPTKAKTMKPQTSLKRPDGAACMYCARCQESFPIPLGTTDWVVALLKAFDKAHRHCHPPEAGDTTRRCALQQVPGMALADLDVYKR